jgi:DNA-binding transcriptional LysR family regulator
MSFDGRLLGGIGVLAAVVEAGSFVRAADALGLTQSGVSRAIARLEQRVGVRLLYRTARAVSLTDEGRRFYEDVAPLLQGIESAATHAAGAGAEVRGRLRVNVDPPFGHFLLAPRLPEFLAAHPDLSVDLYVRDHLGDFVGEGFDVAVRFGEPEPSGLTCRLLMRAKVLTCASRAYLARLGTPGHPHELVDHECLLIRDPATGRPFAWELRRGEETVPVAVRGRLMVNAAESLIACCLGGHGIAQPLDYMVADMLADGRLVQLLPEWSDETFPAYFYHRAQGLPPAKLRAFLDFLTRIV